MAVNNLKFERIALTDFVGRYLVLVFYPFDFTYVWYKIINKKLINIFLISPTELIAYSDEIE